MSDTVAGKKTSGTRHSRRTAEKTPFAETESERILNEQRPRPVLTEEIGELHLRENLDRVLTFETDR